MQHTPTHDRHGPTPAPDPRGGRIATRWVGGLGLGLGLALVALACAAGGEPGSSATVSTSSSNAGNAPGNVAAHAGSQGAVHAPSAHFAPPPAMGVVTPEATAVPPQRLLSTALTTRPPGPFGIEGPSSELATWSQRRAFDGAPPVIPHSADFGSGATTCLDCHVEGMSLGGRVARPMSHPVLTSCEQCHVEAAHSWLLPTPQVENSFVGLGLAGPGERSAVGAPPTMPHSVWMRGNCLACHGEYGFAELRTTHTDRANCVQCHVSEEGVTR